MSNESFGITDLWCRPITDKTKICPYCFSYEEIGDGFSVINSVCRKPTGIGCISEVKLSDPKRLRWWI